MLRTAARSSYRRPHYQRYLATATGHIPHLSSIIDDLITRKEQKIAILHISDRSHSHHRRAYSYSKKAKLCDGRVNHPVRKFAFKAERHSKCAAPTARPSDILANTEHRLIPLHFFSNRFTKSLGDCSSFHLPAFVFFRHKHQKSDHPALAAERIFPARLQTLFHDRSLLEYLRVRPHQYCP